jgi:hypothetical protein
MMQLTIEIPEELASRLQPVRDRLLKINDPERIRVRQALIAATRYP